MNIKKKIEWILANPKECNKIVTNAYHEFNKKYSSETNYRQLIKIYEDAIKNYKN